uniref:Uncharacterized protein n=1 Tax=Nicotiana tabacum TaxID=4097 RepID=A0A1S3YZD2_TOBAC|nr:PREDICTED: uncharacterized protein LOC107781304 [Nicotiana tabacum]
MDATKSTMEELEQVALFEEFLDRMFHLGTGLNTELRYHIGDSGPQTKSGSKLPTGKAKEVLDSRGYHLKHLQENLEILRKHNMKLNPEKFAFGVGSGKFLGFLLSQRGIEVNPNNIKAIKDIPDQMTSVKEVQSLTGRFAALSRFISRSSEKFYRFFSLLKKKNDFACTPECQQALKDIKRQAAANYLAVSEVAVSAVLIREEEDFVADFGSRVMPLVAKEAVLVSGTILGV